MRWLPFKDDAGEALDVIELVADHLASGAASELASELREKLLLQVSALRRTALVSEIEQSVRVAEARVAAAITKAELGEAGIAALAERFDVAL